MKLLVNPSLDEACSAFKDAMSSGEVVIIVGECEVEYEGRAASTLTSGERVVIFKQDGSLLVHRPEGYEPVNWQPPGCSFRASVTDEVFRVSATRLSPYEVLTISFSKVKLLFSEKLQDRGAFSLYASEEDMKRAIQLNPALIEEGLRLLTSEKDLGEAGYADFVGEDSNGNFVVIEVKRTSAGVEEVLQLARYVNEAKQRVNRPIRGILVAPSLRKGGQKLLEQLKLEFKMLSPERCRRELKRGRDVGLMEFMGLKR
ncbi:MAG: endonuclease NucS [Thermoprotei archaeon]|nr:MAG: endonuclease NucS [Thermoprotei archaeon]